MKKVFITATFLSVLFFTGCVSSSTHINTLKVSISEAPEVHGMNTNLSTHSSMLRINGKINVSIHKDMSHSKDENEVYEMDRVDIAGKIDYLYKANKFMLGMGLAIDDGVYHHFTLGWNFSHFEFGGFLGLFHKYSDIQYSGEKCTATKRQNVSLDGTVLWTTDVCTSYSPLERNTFDLNTNIFVGTFAGVFIDKYFFNYSLSFYSPDIEIEGDGYDLPSITSHYFTLGYKLNKKIEFSVGAVLTKIDYYNPKWIYGITGSVNYYLK